MRRIILLAAAALVLVLVNVNIRQREQLITGGRTVLLELAPVDPRSFMQGDYMALRFQVADEAFPRGGGGRAKNGRLVLAVDPRQVGAFRRFADGRLAADEVLLRYRIRNDQPKFATNAFFFQERQGHLYQGAKYGEFRVAADGEAILVALRGAELQTLGPPPHEER
jgi:uncharacterized membrane-anchored protein